MTGETLGVADSPDSADTLRWGSGGAAGAARMRGPSRGEAPFIRESSLRAPAAGAGGVGMRGMPATIIAWTSGGNE